MNFAHGVTKAIECSFQHFDRHSNNTCPSCQRPISLITITSAAKAMMAGIITLIRWTFPLTDRESVADEIFCRADDSVKPVLIIFQEGQAICRIESNSYSSVPDEMERSCSP